MAETETVETTSTPAETVEDTSTSAEPETADTSVQEPETQTDAAEENGQGTETKKLFADKYENVEELEKGYKELQGSFSKAKEFETKYNELLKNQELAQQRREQEQLEKAQQRGFNTYEEQQIADKVALSEYQYYANGLNTVNPEDYQNVSELLTNYYASGNRAYLEEAKRYYTSDFIENVALAKNNLKTQLQNQFRTQKEQARQKADEELGNAIKQNYGDFLADINENEGKAKALQMFCNAGFITSLDDFAEFQSIYNSIAKKAGEQAIKQFEAQKAIDAEKSKAIIPTGSQAQPQTETGLPTAEELRTNPKLYGKAVKKWGMDKVDEIIMKG